MRYFKAKHLIISLLFMGFTLQVNECQVNDRIRMGILGPVLKVSRTGYKLEHAQLVNGEWTYSKRAYSEGFSTFGKKGSLKRRYYKIDIGPTFPKNDGFYISDQQLISPNLWLVKDGAGEVVEGVVRRCEGPNKVIEERYDPDHNLTYIVESELNSKGQNTTEKGLMFQGDSALITDRYVNYYNEQGQIDTFTIYKQKGDTVVYTYLRSNPDQQGNPGEVITMRNDTPEMMYHQKYKYYP